jgi:tRNA(adenine34) deaminase
MCAGAVVMARVRRLVFGAWNEEYGAAGSRWDLVRDRRLNHRTEVMGGILADECGAIVRNFLMPQRSSQEDR